ncbi:MAG: PTS system mannose/fructose/sorbose family transporter subunit IID [Endomicrobiales bacterium]|nr:PTS system mannose/fructose/sorbose family transporter subunit IID [Endomicrobiales bacterium]
MKYAIFLSMLWRSLFLQALWNFERMQNIGFAYVLLPLLKKIYPDKDDRKAAVIRHLEFFNTNPYVVNFIFGFIAAMEEDLVKGKDLTKEQISSLKINVAGPLAAIGDKFFWATWRSFTALLSISLIIYFHDINDFRGTWLPPLFFLLIYNILTVFFRYWSLRISYRYRKKVVKLITKMEFRYLINAVRYIGLLFLVFILVFYLYLNFSNIQQLAVFILILLLSMLFIMLQFVPAILLYSIIAICIGISWLNSVLQLNLYM